MNNKSLHKIFDFIQEKTGKNPPLKWKFIYAPETLTKEELDFKGRLNLSFTNVTSLPEGLKVSGGLTLFYCKTIPSLPKNLDVGSLSIVDSNIDSLPEGLIVRGDLDAQNSELRTLPKNIRIDGYFQISRTPLANEVARGNPTVEYIQRLTGCKKIHL